MKKKKKKLPSQKIDIIIKILWSGQSSCKMEEEVFRSNDSNSKKFFP